MEYTYQEIIALINDSHLPFKVREITTSNDWQIEAYFKHVVSGVAVTIIFKEDILSVYRDYNQTQVDELIANLQDHYNNVKELLKL